MTHHPHYNDALTLLANLLDTTPDILVTIAKDNTTAEGLRTAHQIEIACRYTEAIYQRGQAEAKR